MNNKKDPMEQIILEDILKEAEAIDEEVLKNGIVPMSDDLKEKIKKNIYAQVEEIEKERLYAQLSEEDRKALELGREMLKKADAHDEEKVVRCRKRPKVYLAVAAVAVLVLAMGITSIGGAERVIEMMKSVVGEREVVKVNTDEDNYIVEVDKEEEAYQEIKDVFGVEAVKPTDWPDGTTFVGAEIDENLQMVLLKYECKEGIINYFINSHHTDSSWGIDVEDKIVEQYYVENENGKVLIKEYQSNDSKIKSYGTKFTHNNLDYFLIGTMNKGDFENLVKNLRFF